MKQLFTNELLKFFFLRNNYLSFKSNYSLINLKLVT